MILEFRVYPVQVFTFKFSSFGFTKIQSTFFLLGIDVTVL